jgi:hypothetical protein
MNPLRAIGIALSCLCLACPSAPRASDGAPVEPQSQACEDPRPEICAQIYEPVCAERDTGIRCVKAPCDSTERREYPNACAACRDPKVHSYTPGPC